MSDIIVRALKTFVQAFFGVIIAESGAIMTTALTWKDLKAVGAAVMPIVVAAVSAGISAVWNYLLTKFNKTEEEET